ncbi:MAG: flotillin-like FloA family protein, partial [bacterium]|nr:flotillin-like FloA family protein [bacterium]
MLVTAACLASPALALAQPAGGRTTGGNTSGIFWVGIVVALVIGLVLLIIVFNFLNLYIQALFSNAHIGLIDMIGMRLRKVDLRTVVYSRIRAKKSGMDIPTSAIETHYLAGGRVPNVISAMIAARGARIELPWNI